MRTRKQRRPQQKRNFEKPKIIRCMKHMKPVFDNEKCNDFTPQNTGVPTICKFCAHNQK